MYTHELQNKYKVLGCIFTFYDTLRTTDRKRNRCRYIFGIQLRFLLLSMPERHSMISIPVDFGY